MNTRNEIKKSFFVIMVTVLLYQIGFAVFAFWLKEIPAVCVVLVGIICLIQVLLYFLVVSKKVIDIYESRHYLSMGALPAALSFVVISVFLIGEKPTDYAVSFVCLIIVSMVTTFCVMFLYKRWKKKKTDKIATSKYIAPSFIVIFALIVILKLLSTSVALILISVISAILFTICFPFIKMLQSADTL